MIPSPFNFPNVSKWNVIFNKELKKKLLYINWLLVIFFVCVA